VRQPISQLRAQGKSAEEVAANNEIAVVLESLIAALPESLQDAMRLSTVEELAPAEIAGARNNRSFSALAAVPGKTGSERQAESIGNEPWNGAIETNSISCSMVRCSNTAMSSRG
jgi:hypothetical protein